MQASPRLTPEEIAQLHQELLSLETADSPFVRVFRTGIRIALCAAVAGYFLPLLYEQLKAAGILF